MKVFKQKHIEPKEVYCVDCVHYVKVETEEDYYSHRCNAFRTETLDPVTKRIIVKDDLVLCRYMRSMTGECRQGKYYKPKNST